jgi:hypothetical protein
MEPRRVASRAQAASVDRHHDSQQDGPGPLDGRDVGRSVSAFLGVAATCDWAGRRLRERHAREERLGFLGEY